MKELRLIFHFMSGKYDKLIDYSLTKINRTNERKQKQKFYAYKWFVWLWIFLV